MASKIGLTFTALLIAVANGASVPPSPDEPALMARYIVNRAEWSSVGTISTRENSKGYPYVSLVSSSDGPLEKGSGILYYFITPLDAVGQDLEKNSQVTVLVTLAQGDYCKSQDYDPMDPRCARVVFTGRIRKLTKDDPEYEKAKEAIFTRHEWLSKMPESHRFYFAKLVIETILVFTKFGAPKYITPTEYFSIDSNANQNYARFLN